MTENTNVDNPNPQPSFEDAMKAKKEFLELITNCVKDGVKSITDLIKLYVEKKYKHDFTGVIIFGIIVLFILITICFLGYNSRITESTIGTILGSLIGYALGRFNNNNQSKER